ncbi:hemerythrin domain-containing protein [Anaeromyxobacter paludicola]|uniref:Cation-binding protein n=1 Tax=Anaeromyxobacter paludicola TaxID=2918171 RepID=A0ABM7X7Z5_9BACT|nr:hemerythrin domain-containing protein [Anaeromyxobacter paludicola]BDG07956.1 cation-binding protein [Anaeromyxobacter paludicola]
MDAIETLMQEHRLIESAIDALAAYADELRRRQAVGTAEDRAELGRFVAFVREFADAHHHGKEEDILFAAMVEAGFPRHAGPIAVMLMEHDEGRRQIAVLKGLVEQQAPWTDLDRARLVEAAGGYAQLLHNHIHKEDAILYPMAEQRLAPAALDAVSAACERYEVEKGASGRPAELAKSAEALVARHAPARAACGAGAGPRFPVSGGCC